MTHQFAEALYNQKELTTEEIAKQLNISRTTLYKYLKARSNVKKIVIR
ncbi:helix-turn-helix domain-containing protein [Fastidiosibacter lacustris]|nr:helix-turn-helix domain-containing protein [Fastidiosibacter lacustris]